MPLYAIGNMFDCISHPCDLLLVTTNAFVKNNGELVMGRGAALTMKELWPASANIFGSLVRQWTQMNEGEEYGVLIDGESQNPKRGIFQVKYHWSDDASLDLIKESTDILKRVASMIPYQSARIHLNYPGIGNGRLREGDVRPVIERLPGNVTVWKLR